MIAVTVYIPTSCGLRKQHRIFDEWYSQRESAGIHAFIASDSNNSWISSNRTTFWPWVSHGIHNKVAGSV